MTYTHIKYRATVDFLCSPVHRCMSPLYELLPYDDRVRLILLTLLYHPKYGLLRNFASQQHNAANEATTETTSTSAECNQAESVRKTNHVLVSERDAPAGARGAELFQLEAVEQLPCLDDPAQRFLESDFMFYAVKGVHVTDFGFMRLCYHNKTSTLFVDRAPSTSTTTLPTRRPLAPSK